MRYIIIISIFTLLCGCKPRPADRGVLEIPTDFIQLTKYPELTDDDYSNGHVTYRIKDQNDITRVCVHGITDEAKIDAIVEEFISLINKRNITPHLVAEFYEDITPIDEGLMVGKLIKTIEIKDF